MKAPLFLLFYFEIVLRVRVSSFFDTTIAPVYYYRCSKKKVMAIIYNNDVKGDVRRCLCQEGPIKGP